MYARTLLDILCSRYAASNLTLVALSGTGGKCAMQAGAEVCKTKGISPAEMEELCAVASARGDAEREREKK